MQDLALYRFFNIDGDLLYIGKTVNAWARITHHRNGSKFYPQIAVIKLQWGFRTEYELAEAEVDAIRSERPRYNVVNHPDRPPRLPTGLNAKFTDNDVRDIRSMNGYRSVSEIASYFGVTTETVYNIRRHHTWRHVKCDPALECPVCLGLSYSMPSRRRGVKSRLPAETVERIVAEREAGYRLSMIAARLERDGVPTAFGGRWGSGTIKQVLTRVHREAEAAMVLDLDNTSNTETVS